MSPCQIETVSSREGKVVVKYRYSAASHRVNKTAQGAQRKVGVLGLGHALEFGAGTSQRLRGDGSDPGA